MSRTTTDLQHTYEILRLVGLVLDDGPWLANTGLESILSEANALATERTAFAAPADASARVEYLIDKAEELVHHAANALAELVVLTARDAARTREESAPGQVELLTVFDRFIRLQGAG
jgi:hypothetical protein